jgi:hypothetical protein
MLKWAGASRLLNLQNAGALLKAGFRDKRALTALGAIFRGVDLPDLASKSKIGPRFWANLQGKPGHLGRGLVRGIGVGGIGLAAWSMLPRNNVLATGAGIGAGAAAFAGLSRFPQLMQGMGGLGLRAGGSFFAGSMAWQGLRKPEPSDYRPLA